MYPGRVVVEAGGRSRPVASGILPSRNPNTSVYDVHGLRGTGASLHNGTEPQRRFSSITHAQKTERGTPFGAPRSVGLVEAGGIDDR